MIQGSSFSNITNVISTIAKLSTGSEKNLIAQLVSRLSLSEKYGSGRTMGTSRVLLYVSISVPSLKRETSFNKRFIIHCTYMYM